MPNLLTIDGSQGEGGGQILRTSLSLSLITGTPFTIANIRANRAKPGLMRQHLTCVLAAAAVGSAAVHGAHVGSTEVTFTPGPVKPGPYHFAIGTAGSTMLVLQTVLPPLLTAPAPSTITIEGGTHNTHAPPAEFIDRVFLPLVSRMGPRATLRVERHGFYPAGGGRVVCDIQPAPALLPLNLETRGQILERRATALISQLAPAIAERELAVVQRMLGWDAACLHVYTPAARSGPGNAVMIELRTEHGAELFSAIGEVRRSAESVAEEAALAARDYIALGAPVGPHTADQILALLALAGAGSFVTGPLTPHTTTNMGVVRAFLGVEFDVADAGNKRVRVAVR